MCAFCVPMRKSSEGLLSCFRGRPQADESSLEKLLGACAHPACPKLPLACRILRELRADCECRDGAVFLPALAAYIRASARCGPSTTARRESPHGPIDHQRSRPRHRCGPEYTAALGAAGAGRPYRLQVRLRRGSVRRLHRAYRRQSGALLRVAGQRADSRAEDHHHRRTVQGRLASAATGLAEARRAPVRLLPVGHDHGGGGAAEEESQAHRCGHRRRDHQHLPLRHLQPRARSHQAGRLGHAGQAEH